MAVAGRSRAAPKTSRALGAAWSHPTTGGRPPGAAPRPDSAPDAVAARPRAGTVSLRAVSSAPRPRDASAIWPHGWWNVAGQSRGHRSRRGSCFTWNTPAEMPRGWRPGVGEQPSLVISLSPLDASAHSGRQDSSGWSPRETHVVWLGRHAPGLGATAHVLSPRLTPAPQSGGRWSTTLRRCTVPPGHCTLFADAGPVGRRATPPPHGRRAPSPP